MGDIDAGGGAGSGGPAVDPKKAETKKGVENLKAMGYKFKNEEKFTGKK